MNEKPQSPNNRGNRHNNRRNKPKAEPQNTQVEWNPQPCSICSEIVQEMSSAIAYGPEHLPAHMECVLKELEKRETPGTGERLLYIGAGNFALVKDSETGSLEIVKKIPVETKDNAPEWRKDIRNQISKSP
ncbi:MAG: hypothetical protein A2Z96_05315 [Spirochaetes bacterium GWB1_48_6]|nr:MAG: hypothetical protein A2Z96_05315 [Spirochaetes bacterium GWB1_48_6]